MIKIIFNNTTALKISNDQIAKTVKKSQKFEPKIQGEVEINVVSDEAIKKLNSLYRHKNKVTDVLSFAWQEDKIFKSDILGQIFISGKQIQRQAKEYGVSFSEEFNRMLIHGLLHLVGYDHLVASDAKKMLPLQEKILASI